MRHKPRRTNIIYPAGVWCHSVIIQANLQSQMLLKSSCSAINYYGVVRQSRRDATQSLPQFTKVGYTCFGGRCKGSRLI